MEFLRPATPILTEAERVLERRTRWIFRIGLVIYVLSLLLPTWGSRGSSLPGFAYQFLPFVWALFVIPFELFRIRTLCDAALIARQTALLVASASTNILLATTAWLQWADPDARRSFWLRLATVATIPVSWLWFANQQDRGLEGYVAWLVAIALILFCRQLAAGMSRLGTR